MFTQFIYAFFSTLGFAVIFNLEPRKAVTASIGGGIGWIVYSMSLDIIHTESTSFLLGAVALTLFGEVMARKMRTPVTSFVTAALIPLVPGSGLYNAMLDSLAGDYSGAASSLINTMNNAGALAIGILLVFTGSRAYTYYQSTRGAIK